MTDVTPQPGDFAVVRLDGRVGRLIRLGQWLNGDGFADYEHAFVYVGDRMVVEAEPGGARWTPLAAYGGRPILWSTGRIDLTGAQRNSVVAAAERYVDTPYSFLDYLELSAHRLRLPLPGLRRYIADSRHLICSQLVDQAYADVGVHLFRDGRWPGYVTPADLAKLVQGEQR